MADEASETAEVCIIPVDPGARIRTGRYNVERLGSNYIRFHRIVADNDGNKDIISVHTDLAFRGMIMLGPHKIWLDVTVAKNGVRESRSAAEGYAHEIKDGLWIIVLCPHVVANAAPVSA